MLTPSGNDMGDMGGRGTCAAQIPETLRIHSGFHLIQSDLWVKCGGPADKNRFPITAVFMSGGTLKEIKRVMSRGNLFSADYSLDRKSQPSYPDWFKNCR